MNTENVSLDEAYTYVTTSMSSVPGYIMHVYLGQNIYMQLGHVQIVCVSM